MLIFFGGGKGKYSPTGKRESIAVNFGVVAELGSREDTAYCFIIKFVQCVDHRLTELCVLLDKFRLEIPKQAQHVVQRCV